ncbi:MAG TPA: hypothetical protein VEO54_21855 [Thermoanaerobaculia bacterium]|nr:hypothetical protein [Thermoanaerobaculia bacterium]
MTAASSAFDVQALGSEMIAAARTALADRAPALEALAEMELRRLAGVLAEIGGLLAKGRIEKKRARGLIEIHRFTTRSVLLSLEGIGLLAADQAMKAVMRVAGAVLNRVVGFKVL